MIEDPVENTFQIVRELVDCCRAGFGGLRFDREDALNVIYHVEGLDDSRIESGRRPDLFIGPSRDRRMITKVMAAVTPPNDILVFNVMAGSRKILDIAERGKIRMSKLKATGGRGLTPEEQAKYQALAEWAEQAGIGPDAKISKSNGPGDGRSLMEAALGSPEAITLTIGKPSLSGKGVLPPRTIRPPEEMDARLLAQSER